MSVENRFPMGGAGFKSPTALTSRYEKGIRSSQKINLLFLSQLPPHYKPNADMMAYMHRL